MEASAVNPINDTGNISDASNSFAAFGSANAEGSVLTGSNLFAGSSGSSPIPGGGINPFAGDGGSKLQQLIFDRLKLVLGDDFFKNNDATLAGGSNPFAGGGNPFAGGGNTFPEGSGNTFTSDRNPLAGGSNTFPEGSGNTFTGGSSPFAGGGGGSLFQQSPFDPLREVLGDNIPFSGKDGNTSFTAAGGQSYNESNAPVGKNNRNFGTDNATIGNGNSDFASYSATIGNGNWNFDNDNATIGNGNWLFAGGNTTIGNGNWYWDNGSYNATLGNGNWHFGSNNATIGNGNWDFGINNTIIGNGNWVFTNGNTVVGNGNWLVDSDNTTIGLTDKTESLELFPQGIRADADSLINALMGKIGKDFVGLTKDFGVSNTETFNRLILSKGAGTNDSDISTNFERFLALLGGTPGNPAYQSVPEPTSSVSLVLMGLICLLWSKLKKG
jgi:hypothetical protein